MLSYLHTKTAVKFSSHGYPAVPSSWVNTDVYGAEWFDEIMVINRVSVTVCAENLLEDSWMLLSDDKTFIPSLINASLAVRDCRVVGDWVSVVPNCIMGLS